MKSGRQEDVHGGSSHPFSPPGPGPRLAPLVSPTQGGTAEHCSGRAWTPPTRRRSVSGGRRTTRRARPSPPAAVLYGAATRVLQGRGVRVPEVQGGLGVAGSLHCAALKHEIKRAALLVFVRSGKYSWHTTGRLGRTAQEGAWRGVVLREEIHWTAPHRSSLGTQR